MTRRRRPSRQHSSPHKVPPWWPEEGAKPAAFFARAPVFRFEEFRDWHTRGGRSPKTTAAILAWHVAAGTLRSLRRGLYATTGPVDPWVIASRLSTDAVIAYDGAFSFYDFTGLGYGISFLTRERSTRFVFNEVVYKAVKPPQALGGFGDHIEEREHAGQVLRITTRERTFVDLLDRLEFCPAIDPLNDDLRPDLAFLYKTIKTTRGLDLDAMADHALALGSRLTAVRLGLLLSYRRDTPDSILRKLERLVSDLPDYFDRAHRTGGEHLMARWGLMVPAELLAAMRG